MSVATEENATNTNRRADQSDPNQNLSESKHDTEVTQANKQDPKYDAKTLANLKKENEILEKKIKLKENRIALLKLEERKNEKILDETRKRASSIQKTKEGRMENEKTIAELLRQNEEQRTKNILNDSKITEPNEYKKKQYGLSKVKKIEDSKLEKAKLQKELEAEHKRQNDELKGKLYKFNKMRNDGEIKKEKYKENKEAIFKKEKKQLLDEEQTALKKKEDDIAKMEKEEAALIKRLQATQALQSKAYEELTSAVNLSSKEFSEKFLSNNNTNKEKSEGKENAVKESENNNPE